MRIKTSLISTLVLAVAILMPIPIAQAASNERALHFFQDTASDGAFPYAALITDSAGNLYGTTYMGGSGDCTYYPEGTGCGVVFELVRGQKGQWTEKIIYNFQDNGKDGTNPAAGLISDASGNLYGTTVHGGSGECSIDAAGCGTVFKLIRGKNGRWTEQALHEFGSQNGDGWAPVDSLVFDAAGNLYGTTRFGGTATQCNNLGCGTVFALSPGSNSKWTEKVLQRFNYNDGAYPAAGLILDKAGNLYGTTSASNTKCGGGCGNVFELVHGSSGQWTEKILYTFQENGQDGSIPMAGLVFDTAGKLYGTTEYGGTAPECVDGCGTVFQLTPNSKSRWTEKVLYNFELDSTDGAYPTSGVLVDGTGKLYGTTSSGYGTGCGGAGCGTVFELTSGKDGQWKETVLHGFTDSETDGGDPNGLTFGEGGNLYGTSIVGGGSGCASYGCGTVFEVTP
jgi:uncharacterized repeat protein (TIGR03803 family)